jgi:hypothetical protein
LVISAEANLLRDLVNERARVKRRLDKARKKLAGIRVLEEELRPYLQPGDYAHIKERLAGACKRLDEWERDLERAVHEERMKQNLGEERYEEYKQEMAQLLERLKQRR